jgi:hypothetical protein
VATLGAITIMIFTFIVIGLHGFVEKIFSLFDLIPYSGKVGESERGTVFFNQIF